MNGAHVETERKFLIRIPRISDMEAQKEFRIRKIKQTYLKSAPKRNARVRYIEENGKITYVKTVKERISTLSCFEDESEISLDEYESLLLTADQEKKSICKTRYSFAFDGHIIEIDVYDFWDDRATLEIELSSEDESFSIPSFITVIKEISFDGRYKNTNLAKNVPYDEI